MSKTELDVVRKNDNYTVEITGMTHEGQGVGRINNFTVFVDGAVTGETAEIKIIKITKSYAIGKLLKVLKSSADRTEPFCPAYKRCGGCSLQHVNYEGQLKFKTNLVKDTIKRIGKIEGAVIHDAIGMQSPLNYRNKAQFPVGQGTNGPAIGFYAKRSHEIIDHDACGIQDEISDSIRNKVKAFVSKNGISIYDEAAGKGLVRHIMVRTGFKTGEVMVVIVINGNELPKSKELVEMLTHGVQSESQDEKEWKVTSIYLNINKKNTNVILGEKNVKLSGNDTITDYIGKYRFSISPHSFFQVNPVQTEVLYQKALEYAQLTGNETVFDLYCGIGTISLFLSEKAKKVYGVEVVEAAIEDARKNAEVNGVRNTEFMVGEAEKVIPEIYEKGVKADVVVVDPPRKGCDEVLLKTLVDMRPKRIVYVSCNPSTLARDLNYLESNGFKTVEIQPVDMFPWTHHVESIVLMTNSGLKGK
ncbi:MAG: 23S rRNA (uracil(1939)-C(5))-methyltransferase RlmD [Clostridia bacterium]|nr:23S rRNA (uracil(1939)-C(5))-methyltransferase RlmD [Clostridia bacterium]